MKLLYSILLLILSSCHQTKPKTSHTLFIAIDRDPLALDPSKIIDNSGKNFAHLFYEGLTRLDAKGHPQLALANKVHLSSDQMTYTFTLRPSQWSNGEPLTAYDFERSWKHYLDPTHPSSHASMLYLIQGAREISEGKTSLEALRAYAQDDSTLVVHLTEPVPYFLDLLASYFYYPFHPEGHSINNGPFTLKHWIKLNEIVAIKNLFYWDSDSVKLSEITFPIVDSNTALQLYEKGEIDLIGAPVGRLPADAIPVLKNRQDFFTSPSNATFFVTVNTAAAPFDNKDIRQAFRNTIHRKELSEHVLHGNQSPAYSLVPFSFSQHPFEESTESLTDPLPQITLTYASSEINHKIAQALQDQWRVNLGVNIELQSFEAKVYFEKLRKGEFQMVIGGWFADYSDPISFLDVFKEIDNGMNNSNWENPQYISLLNQSSHECHPDKRLELLKQAERILIDETPMIPLFHYVHNYMHPIGLKDAYVSEFGYIDFKYADIVR